MNLATNRFRVVSKFALAAFIAVGLPGEVNAQSPAFKGEPTAQSKGDTSSLLKANLHGDEKIATPAGVIELQDSFFGPDASEKIYAEMDYQRACQCYLWSHPLVSMKTWQEEQARAFDAHGDNDFVVLQTLDEKRGVVTGNLTTPYIINFINLSDGPILIDYPAGRTLTGFLDLWQRPFGYAGLTGPDRGKGGRYVLVGPGTKMADVVVENASVFQSPTNNIAFTQRILDNDPEFYAKFKSEMRIGRLGKPLAECRFIEGRDAKWSGTAPRGIAYWERLARLINEEPVRPIDKAWMAMLLPLGIKRGTDFAPNEHQREALLKGAAMGELMARNLQVFPRFTKPYWDGTQWYKSFDFSIEQELPERIELDERTTWFYEAVTSSKEMVTPHVGSGQVYMTTKRDSKGRMLQADKLYRLRVPKDVPAGQFWALTLYSENTRRPYDNGLNSVRSINLDSRLTDLQRNADGSVDLYIGPNAPEGWESNWMKTSGDDGWFVYFRLYAPQQPFFDKTFRLPDFIMME